MKTTAANPDPDTFLPTRRSLIARLKDWNDDDSWRDFFNTYWRLIYSFARKAGLNEAEAQEVVQETVITVARKMPEFEYDPGRGAFKAWLRNTTKWRILDQKRRRQRDKRFEPTAPDLIGELPSPEGHAGHSPELEGLWQAEWERNLVNLALEAVKRQVAPREFQVFDFCTVQGRTPADVARDLGMIRPQVYYLNKKVARLVRDAVETLQRDMG